ncbi:MAG: sulfatase-like hydrolase/transferase [Chloroflexota bacterium]|nr:sulfatase-like hydrolase/transferase [Chloroflexota bacterium]
MYGYQINENGTLKNYGTNTKDYQVDVIANKASTFIRSADGRNDAQPFFLLLTPASPHFEVTTILSMQSYSDQWKLTIRPAKRHQGTIKATLPAVDSFNEVDISDKPAWLQKFPLMTDTDMANNAKRYNDMLEATRAIDDLVGTVFSALEQTKEIGNTAIIFVSDNGYNYGEHRLAEKMHVYEESLRVPLYLTAPGFTTKQSISRTVINTDLAPTIAQFAGVTPSLTVDGTSFIPLLSNPNQSWRKRHLIEHGLFKEGVFHFPPYAAIRTFEGDLMPHLLYAEYQDAALPNTEFYDVTQDPYQLTSLYNDESRSSQRARLATLLGQLKSCTGQTCYSLEFD